MKDLSFQHYLLGLFAVANNIPAIPLYLILIDGLSRKEQNRLSLVATSASFITMVVSMVTGVDVLTKIFGLITLALGVQFILTGISGAFPGL